MALASPNNIKLNQNFFLLQSTIKFTFELLKVRTFLTQKKCPVLPSIARYVLPLIPLPRNTVRSHCTCLLYSPSSTHSVCQTEFKIRKLNENVMKIYMIIVCSGRRSAEYHVLTPMYSASMIPSQNFLSSLISSFLSCSRSSSQ